MMQFSESMLADPQVFQLGRLAPHSSHLFRFGNGDACCLSLDGVWDFRYAAAPGAVPGAWGRITVPGHIQMQGGPEYPYGTPQYVNTQYPWDGREALRPGMIPRRENPVGEYRRSFTLPAGWKNCFIRFEGADSALALYCNGQFAGYSESSFDAAEFDLTALVHPGENELTAKVYRFSSGSWLEDQDFWRMSGIFRPVTLFTKPAAHIEDIRMETTFTADYAAAEVRFFCKMSGDLTGNLGLSFAGCLDEQPLAPVVELCARVEHPRLWSAEHPNLYDAAFVVHGGNDQMVEIAGFKAGLREFALRDGVLCLNGKRLVFKGVDRHEWSAYHGRAVTEEETEWDILNLKRHNVNAVRTSHYPNRSFFYEMCDRYGLYVIDEMNLETHGTWQNTQRQGPGPDTLPGDKPEWRAAVLARAAAVLERDKNHPCVLMWSCGNESCGGSTLQVVHDYFRAADPSRLVHYEGVFHDRTYPGTSDVESQMYTPAAEVEAFIAAHPDKPFILCEYGHAMGNSCGELDAYTELAWRERLYQGGFLWEYMDHGLVHTRPDGSMALAYGGDFGDRPTDYEFCADGLVTATRDNSPKMKTVRDVYADFVLDVAEDGITIQNRSLFTDLSEYTLVFTLKENGEARESREERRALAPGGTLTLSPLPIAVPERAGLFTLDAAVVRAADTPWARAGSAVARGQAVFDRTAPAPAPTGPIELVEGGYNYGIRGEGFAYLISRVNGRLVSMRLNGVETLMCPAELEFWRAPTCNDTGAAMPFHFAKWAQAGRYARCDAVAAERAEGAVLVHTRYTLATEAGEQLGAEWRFTPDGRCTLTLIWEGEQAEVPAFGMLFTLDSGYQNVEFLGRGPVETMPDRKNGTLVGRWRYGVQDNNAVYLVPQEYGARTDVRTATLTGGRRLPAVTFGCRERAGQGMLFSACPWTPQELENARHTWQLPPVTQTVVRCALSERGVGGDDSWGARPHPEYRFALAPGQRFTFSFGK